MGQIRWKEDEQYNAESFLSILQPVVAGCPAGKITMVLNNARIHHVKLLESFLNKHQVRLELVFLPRFSPDLNLGKYSGNGSNDVINNVFYHNTAEIRNIVKVFMDNITKVR